MTRAIGDADAKPDGVTADPEVSETELTKDDEFIVVACDGMWDVITNNEALQMIKDTARIKCTVP